mmetsp:Transcript_7230/g.17090  ORF Transcript_7230/g.17090 Transcript_7230/m.17090 type:complete len:211 (-) Transcript_7230:548-1180(-)
MLRVLWSDLEGGRGHSCALACRIQLSHGEFREHWPDCEGHDSSSCGLHDHGWGPANSHGRLGAAALLAHLSWSDMGEAALRALVAAHPAALRGIHHGPALAQKALAHVSRQAPEAHAVARGESCVGLRRPHRQLLTLRDPLLFDDAVLVAPPAALCRWPHSAVFLAVILMGEPQHPEERRDHAALSAGHSPLGCAHWSACWGCRCHVRAP